MSAPDDDWTLELEPLPLELEEVRTRHAAPAHDHGPPVSIGAGVCRCGLPV